MSYVMSVSIKRRKAVVIPFIHYFLTRVFSLWSLFEELD